MSLANIRRRVTEYLELGGFFNPEAMDHQKVRDLIVDTRTAIDATDIQRFTAFRRNISQRDTHNALQKNADDVPQFEGVIWSDGTVTLRWLTACRSTSVWASIADCLNIHGHPEYGTEIQWHDAPAPPEWIEQCRAAETRFAQSPSAQHSSAGGGA